MGLRKRMSAQETKTDTQSRVRVAVTEEAGCINAMMGYRILHDLAHGATLLKHAEAECRRLGFTGLRLCTGVENTLAQKFYEREGWEAKSLAFKKKVPSH